MSTRIVTYFCVTHITPARNSRYIASFMSDSSNETPPHNTWRPTGVDTLQGLIVAFTIAMAFRGFVLEGFVIPTGSMAPTLLGQHIRVHSDASGYAYTADGGSVFDNGAPPTARAPLVDPMVTRQFSMGETELGRLRAQVVGLSLIHISEPTRPY